MSERGSFESVDLAPSSGGTSPGADVDQNKLSSTETADSEWESYTSHATPGFGEKTAKYNPQRSSREPDMDEEKSPWTDGSYRRDWRGPLYDYADLLPANNLLCHDDGQTYDRVSPKRPRRILEVRKRACSSVSLLTQLLCSDNKSNKSKLRFCVT